jgi:hypothetical protein
MEEQVNYGIRYLRRGEWTEFTNKKGERARFDSVYDVRRYLNKARDNEPNNPVTFMNRVDIYKYIGDKRQEFVESY